MYITAYADILPGNGSANAAANDDFRFRNMQNGNIHFTVPDGGIFDSGDTKTKEVYTNVGLPFVYENGYYTFDASQDSAYFSGTAASETNLTWNDTAEGVSADIAVVADPANVTELCGTHEDILIPSSCLNSTVSGLISRTFLRDDIIGRDDFHGAVYYGELTDSDLSYDFIETIEKEFNMENTPDLEKRVESQGIDEVINIGKNFGIDDINLIKPGIGETTRVLLRRIPWKVLIDERYKGNPQLEHIVRLAEEKHTPVEYYPLIHYKCCGIIKKLADA